MDIRRRTTYLSRGADGRPSHNYSSFFQSAQKKYCNADPESGIRLVGPMFELTACVELRGDEEDFETMYPDTSLSFGPTICSFGLKYNDHNYALPSGLTPPSMAPHLMDLQIPKNKFSDTKLNNSKNLFANKSNSRSEDIGQKHSVDKRFDRQNSLTFKRSALEGNSTYVSDGKKYSGGLWYTKSTDLEDKSLMDSDSKDQYMTSRFGSQISSFEHMELRCEPELKVIEVPEELAVSPSQLSDLDSDTSEVEYVTKIVIPTSDGSYIQPTVDNSWIGNSAWSDVRCVCGNSQPKSGLIRCPKCSTCQHIQCMESYYNVTMPRLGDGYTCNLCGIENTEFQSAPNHSSDVTLNRNANANKDCVSSNDDTSNFIDGVNNSSVKLTPSSDGNIGAHYVEVAADRAKRLGLLSNNCKLDTDSSAYSGSWSAHHIPKEHDTTGRSGWASVNWEKLNEISRSGRRHHGDTDVNLRMPSPPRASKRKQDLTSTSYNDAEVTTADSSSERNSNTTVMLPNSGDEMSSVDVTPSSTPSNTPMKLGTSLPLTPVTPASTPGGTLTPGSGYSNSSGVEGSPRRNKLGGDRSSNKIRRVLFPDGSNSAKRRFDARTNPLGAAWAKDYQEAESNVYTKALLDRVHSRISAGVERNHKIPPTCLTRSSLCRVVLFDHNDKGLEASIRLAPNEVVTEVRGHFLLMEEYEHYVDPVSDYNRYVMFYRGFGDRTVVIDSSQYGNSARFVRRSCIPNCRLEHYVVQNKLQIVIRTSVEVMPGTELTIPFDIDYRACRYPLDCACARSRCPVLKWRRKLLRNKVVPNLDYSKYIESQLRVLSKPLSQESPTNRPYDSGSLTASPLVKTSSSSNNVANQSLNLSPNVNYNLYTLKSPGTFRREIDLPIHDCNSAIADKSNQNDVDTNKNEVLENPASVERTSSTVIIQIEQINSDLITSSNKSVTDSAFVTDENQIPETSQSGVVSTETTSRASLTKIKDSLLRKNQNVNEEKLSAEKGIFQQRKIAFVFTTVQ
ncbi:Histone-lysine N-methyltransferase 2E isoform 1 [Schistosoma japonicum]|uniref:Histone-lysine N-methyltransferase 2E isoform 1 n=1 Tax=Schistosoma japonicum TaxID=6182 RepID=A0A4Z2D7Q0_SCHJA|nr:Histone-lysine N-methyltransferase 2E isoform 1 [Schistosoma japonicum]